MSGFGFFVFHENINLISFSLAKVLIGHGHFHLGGPEALGSKTSLAALPGCSKLHFVVEFTI